MKYYESILFLHNQLVYKKSRKYKNSYTDVKKEKNIELIISL